MDIKSSEFIIKDKPTISEVESFFRLNNEGQQKFRYYKKRSFDILKKHLKTILIYLGDEIVGYGHLERDDKIWLGIMVGDKYLNKGIGNLIMNELLKNVNESIYLTVDIDNFSATVLYLKKGFVFEEKKDYYYLMKKN